MAERYQYWCPKCRAKHFTGSKIGKKHRKYAIKAKQSRIWRA